MNKGGASLYEKALARAIRGAARELDRASGVAGGWLYEDALLGCVYPKYSAVEAIRELIKIGFAERRLVMGRVHVRRVETDGSIVNAHIRARYAESRRMLARLHRVELDAQLEKERTAIDRFGATLRELEEL